MKESNFMQYSIENIQESSAVENVNIENWFWLGKFPHLKEVYEKIGKLEI